MTTDTAAAPPPLDEAPEKGFRVRLTNFEGPFDLLLQLIFAHRLDVTEVALHEVTDEFIAYTRAIGAELELDETTTFGPIVNAAVRTKLPIAYFTNGQNVPDDIEAADVTKISKLVLGKG